MKLLITNEYPEETHLTDDYSNRTSFKLRNKSTPSSLFQVQHIDEILAEVGPGESIKEEGEDDSQVVAPPSDGGSRESETSTSGGQFN